MDPVVVFIIAAAVVIIVVLVHRKNKHPHGHKHHVLGSAGSLGATQDSPYTGECLTNYIANKKLYGSDIATTVAKGCMLYSNPTADPCGCAPAFADSIQSGSSIQSAAKVLKQCMEHNEYDCTKVVCSNYMHGMCENPLCTAHAWTCTN